MVSFAQADSAREIEQAYRLRYEVYCLDRGFEDDQAFPDGLESDRWDATSWHFLCRDHAGDPVGTVRLIPAATNVLPLELRCRITCGEFRLRRPFAAEISRLAIARDYHWEDETRRGGPHADLEESWKRLPIPLLGLIRAIYHKGMSEGITEVLAVMDRRLHALLRRNGVRFRPIGPEIDCHGLRTPYALSIDELEQGCYRYRPDVYRFLRDGLPAGEGATPRDSN